MAMAAWLAKASKLFLSISSKVPSMRLMACTTPMTLPLMIMGQVKSERVTKPLLLSAFLEWRGSLAASAMMMERPSLAQVPAMPSPSLKRIFWTSSGRPRATSK